MSSSHNAVIVTLPIIRHIQLVLLTMTTFYWAANEPDHNWFLIMILSHISNRSSCGLPLSCSFKLLRENEKSYYWIIPWISYSLRLELQV